MLPLHVQTRGSAEHSQSSGLLLREDPDEEVGLVVGLIGGGDQQVIPRRKCEALRHLPHVDVGPAASLGCMVAEEIFTCMVLVIWSLNGGRQTEKDIHNPNSNNYQYMHNNT